MKKVIKYISSFIIFLFIICIISIVLGLLDILIDNASGQEFPVSMPFGLCNIKISVVDEKTNSQKARVHYLRDGKTRTIESMRIAYRILKDFPADGIDTFNIRDWSGGAHCCFTNFLVMSNRKTGRATFQTVTDAMGHSDDFLNDLNLVLPARMCLEVKDRMSFPVGLSSADSPHFSRVIEFDPVKMLWADARPASYRQYFADKYLDAVENHRKLRSSVTKMADINENAMTRLAIEAAYYSYMVSGSTDWLVGAVMNLLPKSVLDGYPGSEIAALCMDVMVHADGFRAVSPWDPD